MGLGQAFAEVKQLPEAIAELETAVQLNPNDPKLQGELEALKQRQIIQNSSGAK